MSPEDFTSALVDYTATMTGAEAAGALACLLLNGVAQLADETVPDEAFRVRMGILLGATNALVARVVVSGAPKPNHEACDGLMAMLNNLSQRMAREAS